MSNQIAKKTSKDWLTSDQLKQQVAQALPGHLTADRFMRVLFTSMQKTPLLMQCTQDSIYSAMITCSQLGIEPDGRRAHMIPFKNNKRGGVYECQLIIDYKGVAELVQRSGKVSSVHADVVCDKDDFEYDMGEVKRHKIDLRKPRGEMYAAYATVTFKDGTRQSAVMSKEEIDGIRKRSKASSYGPWVTDYNEMAKKTVFRRLSKWLPLSPEQRDVIEKDDDQFDHGRAMKTVTPDSDSIFDESFGQQAIESDPKGENPTEEDVPMGGNPKSGKSEKQSAPPAEEEKPDPQASKQYIDIIEDKLLDAGFSPEKFIAFLQGKSLAAKSAKEFKDIPASKLKAIADSIDDLLNEFGAQ